MIYGKPVNHTLLTVQNYEVGNNLLLREWLMWGSEPSRKHPEDTERKNIHPLVASFVATYGQDTFYTPYDEENPKEWAMDPRGWEQVSDIIYDNDGVIRKELLISKMGEELTAAFIGYANNSPLSKKAILAKKYSSSDIPMESDARLALALSLRDANEKEVGPIRKFISDNLGKENLAVFDSLWVGKNDERAVQIAQMQSFINKGR